MIHILRGAEMAARCAPHLEGRTQAVSFQTVGELWAGAAKVGWSDARNQALDRLLRRSVVLACDESTVREWANLKVAAEAEGKAKAAADLWIAATAKRHDIPLLTTDRGFLSALGIRVIRPEDELLD